MGRSATIEASEFDLVPSCLGQRWRHSWKSAKDTKDICVQHLAIVTVGCAVAHHPTTFDKSHELVYQKTFRLYSPVEHHNPRLWKQR